MIGVLRRIRALRKAAGNGKDPADSRPASPGRLIRFPGFCSTFLERERDIVVYLPPGYSDSFRKQFPVLYVQDGQNLFDPETAFIPGRHWGLRETAEEWIGGGKVEPLLIVGVGHGRDKRIDEYTPVRDAKRKAGGEADRYGRFLMEELMPFIATGFRVEAGPRTTGLAGSSLGGLVSLHLALEHPEVFGRVAVLSPSVWWNRSAVVRKVFSLQRRPDLRIWLDIGTEEGRSEVRRARLLRDALRAKGFGPSRMKYVEVAGARHDEEAWGARAGEVLEFLFPAQRSPV